MIDPSEVEENGYYWCKRPKMESDIIHIKGQSVQLGMRVEIVWLYLKGGMMGYDSLERLPQGTKLSGPIKKPARF